jgi:flagellar hook-associated protein 1 FlgK
MSGLFTARSSLGVVSHNTANAATRGYSRQKALVKASAPISDGTGRGMVGTGSYVHAIEQVREQFLDSKYRVQTSIRGEYTGKMNQLSVLENIFNEADEKSGLSAAFNDFFNKASDLSTTANDSTYRTNLIQSASALAEAVNSSGEALSRQQLEANNELAIAVRQINSLGHQIASLNKRIAIMELDGSAANDLRDQRARLIDDIAVLANVEVKELDIGTRENPGKRFALTMNGYEFVNGSSVQELGLRRRSAKKNPMDADGLHDVVFEKLGLEFDMAHPKLKGQIRGLADVRDGNGTGSEYKGIPYYMEKLNTLAVTAAKAADMGIYPDGKPLEGVIGHVNGFNLNGMKSEGGGDDGTLFFTFKGGPETSSGPSGANFIDYSLMNCLNFTVNDAIKGNPALLNCAEDSVHGESSCGVTRGFANINSNPSLFKEGKLLDFISAISSEMGIDASQAKKFDANYSDVIAAIDNERIAYSGVDVNEEMVEMIKHQQLYQASAKLVNVINGIYGTLINELGV